jgi:hypothetical protein
MITLTRDNAKRITAENIGKKGTFESFPPVGKTTQQDIVEYLMLIEKREQMLARRSQILAEINHGA